MDREGKGEDIGRWKGGWGRREGQRASREREKERMKAIERSGCGKERV